MPLPLLASLGIGLGGSLANAAGWKLGEAFGLSPDVNETAGLRGSLAGMQGAIGMLPSMTQASMYSAAGKVGPQVQQTFARALDALAPSARAAATADRLNQLGQRALSGVGTQTSMAQNMAQQQAGDMRRQAFGGLAASGAPAAAYGSVARNLGEGVQRGAGALLGQAGQMQNQALGAAGQFAGSAQNVIDQNLALRNRMYVDPYKAQVNAGAAYPVSQLGQTGGMAATQERVNPLSFLGFGGGMLGAGGLTNYMSQNFGGE